MTETINVTFIISFLEYTQEPSIKTQDQEQKYNSTDEHEELEQYVEEERKNIPFDQPIEEEEDDGNLQHPQRFFGEDESYQPAEFNMFSAFQNPGKDFSLFAPVQDSSFGADDQMSFNLLNDHNNHPEDEDEILHQFGNLQELRNMSENYTYDIANKDISTKFPK